jgi:hypothetical protein
LSALQRLVLLLEVSTTQGPELHLDVSALQRLVLLLEVSTPQGPELHLNVSALQRYVLLLEVSTTQGPELHLDVSHPKGPVPTNYRSCSLCFENNLLTVGSVRFATKIIYLLSNVFALLRK